LIFRSESEKKYTEIVEHYEECLARHGDTHLGVDWPNAEDAKTRYRVMLEVVREPNPRAVKLLDFGCGASHLFEYIAEKQIRGIEYAGLDLSLKFVELSRRKFPQNHYVCADILEEPAAIPTADYIVMNGVFTEKRGLSLGDACVF